MKLATRYYHDPKITVLPDADTELMFVRGLARAGEVGRGGFIPEADLGLLTRRRRMDSCVGALVDAGLWSRVPGGYQVNAWADWQSAADALAARRMADRERQRKHRQSRDKQNVSRDVTDTELEEEKDLPKGGTTTHDPPDDKPPPRRCPTHASLAGPVPACGLCADARRTHTAWLTQHTNGTKPHPLDGQQAAALATATRHMHDPTCPTCSDTGWTLDTDGYAIPCSHQP